MDLTDNFIDADGVAPIRACGTKWVEKKQIKALQRAINKYGIYLIYLKNFGKTFKKSENKGRKFLLGQRMVRLLIPTWDGIHFATVDAVERTLVELAKEDSCHC